MLYLQQMSNIPTQHPDVQQHFSEGLHVIRRRNRLWAGLSSDERPKGKAGATVTVAANMTTTMKKDQFLANRKNKQQFIFMLSTELGRVTYHAPGDADLLIVQKAV